MQINVNHIEGLLKKTNPLMLPIKKCWAGNANVWVKMEQAAQSKQLLGSWCWWRQPRRATQAEQGQTTGKRAVTKLLEPPNDTWFSSLSRDVFKQNTADSWVCICINWAFERSYRLEQFRKFSVLQLNLFASRCLHTHGHAFAHTSWGREKSVPSWDTS